MNSLRDKIRGAFNQGIGRLKQGLSRDTGDRRMEDEGTGQELKGKGQKVVGHAKDIANELAGGVRERMRRTGS